MEEMISPKQCAVRPLTRRPGDRARGASFKIANILVPLDFSRRSLKALKYALPFAERFGATLHLAHVYEHEYPMMLAAMPLVIPETEVARRARRRLQAAAKKHAIAWRRRIAMR
jgi:nucleotide-binding universal stress UspA family protein